MPKTQSTKSAIPAYLEVRDILNELGWSGAECSRRMNVHKNTVQRYKTGGVVPGPVLAYLRLRRQIARIK